MEHSCCGGTPSRIGATHEVEVKEPGTSSATCYGGAPIEKSSQQSSCGDRVTQNNKTSNNNNNTTSSAESEETWFTGPTDPCKGNARRETCEGGCCNDQSTEAIGEKEIGASASKEACCARNPNTEAVKLDRSVSSSSAPWSSDPATAVEPTVAECCEGKSSPCCDETCLDRLALRECNTGSSTHCMAGAGHSFSSTSTPVERAKFNRRACDRHHRSVREQYAARLTALGCICRALLALGKESCCEPRKHSSLGKGRGSERPLKQSLSRSSVESHHASGTSTSRSPRRSTENGGKYKVARGVENGTSERCSSKTCSKPNITTSSVNFTDPCAPETDEIEVNSPGGSCADICCTSKKPALLKDKSGAVSITPDLENQAIGVEHVVLSISGMTCTGCETKLNRTLATVTGVKNLRTSLVLSRAEFDLDLNLSTVDFIMKHLERTTEFKCETITSNGSTMDIIVSGDPFSIVNQAWPEGVSGISLVEDCTVRVSFDPEVVGARDLIEKHWGETAKLAPICADPALAAGSKHVHHSGFMTLLSAVLTIPVLVMAWAPIPEREIAYSSASLALATVIQVVIAGPFYPKALKALLFSRVIEMDLLIVLSTSAAYIFSVVSFGFLVAGKPLSTGQFFETSTLLVTLIMFGRYIATLARQKAVESISIRSLQAQTALLVDKSNSSEAKEIDVRLLQYGDTFKVLPDVKIPTDGTVTSGSSEVNESMLTGESRPVEKSPKSRVIAGTINGSGSLIVKLTRLPVQPVLSQGYTAFCFAIDGALLAVFGLEDSLRADATHVVNTLQRRGVSVHVISGDDEGAVQNVATTLQIPERNVHARSSPADKQIYIKNLLNNCSDGKVPIVIFCGDGTNDAVALAQATIGVHLNEGSDVAKSAADVVLMRPDLSLLLTMMNVGKVSVRRIKFNFIWSFVYNTFAVLLAAGAFVHARIPPQFAGLGELISVLPVIIAAVLLRWSKM